MDQNKIPEAPRPPGRRAAPRSSGWGKRLALVCGLTALALGGGAMLLTLFLGGKQPPPPVTFSYRDQILTAIDGLAVNRYGTEGFSTDPLGRVSYERDGLLAKAGIDVSFYQGEIDWQAVAADGVDFALIRLGFRGYTEGGLFLDSFYKANIQGALEAGLKVGVYFFSQAVNEEEAPEEAMGCAYVLNGRKLDYPIYFDTEASGGKNGRADGLGVEDRTKCAIAFCEEVKAQGYKPGVYASTLWFRQRVDLSRLTGYSIWNAHYGVASSPISCDMWQGSCTARIPGYGGQIDVNISYVG